MITYPDAYDYSQDGTGAPHFISLDEFIANKPMDEKAEELMMFDNEMLANLRDAVIDCDMDNIAFFSDILQRRNKAEYYKAVTAEDSEVIDNG